MGLSEKQKQIILSSIIYLQYMFRWKKLNYMIYESRRRLVYQTLLQLMCKVQKQFSSSVYTQDQYNRLMHQLEKISQDYQKLVNNKPSILRFKKTTLK